MSISAIYDAHRPTIWGLCYRMTGCSADADDLVQATFTRAIERPPKDTESPWRPWLVKVAMNLARDLLRKRRRESYAGPWLPSPIEASSDAITASEDIEGRYGLLESATFAFLLAVEALTPQQRAVLLLRDVFGYAGRETAEALGITLSNTRTTLHRARRQMKAYDVDRCVPTPELEARTAEALSRFMACLTAQDVKGIETLLAADVLALNDSDGQYLSARNPLVGVRRVSRFYLSLTRKSLDKLGTTRVALRTLNGLPALVVHSPDMPPRQARRFVLCPRINDEGRLTAVHVVLADRKLTALRF